RGFRPQEWRYRWDDFDRLREVRTPDGEVWQYRYDAFGRRTAKRNIIRAAWKQNHHTVSEVRYQWLGMALSASEKRYADGSPALREQWHYRGGFELLAKEARAANDDTSDFYPILIGPDGAPQEMYSANGRKVWRRQRSLWGLAAANDASHNARESCDAGFMGQWQDEESGLWYNLHRYMDSRTGQYLSQDPLKLGGGLNTQSYVHDPVGWCDPGGLAGEKCPTVITGDEATTTDSEGNVVPLNEYGVPVGEFTPKSGIPPYSRPGAAGPTTAQTRAVQGKPCVICGKDTGKMVADHKDALVVEYYRTGQNDIAKQTSVDAVQPHCQEHSRSQGGRMSAFSKKMRQILSGAD
ncbi:RHS repeat domain-containing protein, partial [Salmonella enterica subsp. enterica]